MRLVSLVFVLVLHQAWSRHDDDDEPYDPYTTTDPAKREPSPCEGEYKIMKNKEILILGFPRIECNTVV